MLGGVTSPPLSPRYPSRRACVRGPVRCVMSSTFGPSFRRSPLCRRSSTCAVAPSSRWCTMPLLPSLRFISARCVAVIPLYPSPQLPPLCHPFVVPPPLPNTSSRCFLPSIPSHAHHLATCTCTAERVPAHWQQATFPIGSVRTYPEATECSSSNALPDAASAVARATERSCNRESSMARQDPHDARVSCCGSRTTILGPPQMQFPLLQEHSVSTATKQQNTLSLLVQLDTDFCCH